MRIQDSRLLLKRSTTAGLEPTVPTGSTIHTDGTWNVEDIYAGELFLNMDDKKLWFGWEDISGNTGVSLVNPFGYLTGSCITDLYVENINACTNVINLTADDTIFNFVDNISDGYQFTAQYGSSSIILDARSNPLTDASTIQLFPNNNIEILSSDITNSITSQINLDSNTITLISNDSSLITLPTKYEQTSTEINIDSINFFGVTGGTINLEAATQINLNTNLISNDGNLVNGEAIIYAQREDTTTIATPISLYTIPFTSNNSVMTIKAIINGNTVGGGDAYGCEYFGVFKNVGGTVTRLSTLDKSEKTDFPTATSDIIISGTDIIIQVTGQASTNINWVTRLNYQISQ